MSSLSLIQQDLSNVETVIDNLVYQWGTIDGLATDLSDFMAGYDLSSLSNMADNISAYNSDLTTLYNSISEINVTVIDNTIDNAEFLISNIYANLSAIANTLSGFAPNENLTVTLNNATNIFGSISAIDDGVKHLFSVPSETAVNNKIYYDGGEIGGLLKQQLALWYYVNGVPDAVTEVVDSISYYGTTINDVNNNNLLVSRDALAQFDLSTGNDYESKSYADFTTLNAKMNSLGNNVDSTFVAGKTRLATLNSSLTAKINAYKNSSSSWKTGVAPDPVA